METVRGNVVQLPTLTEPKEGRAVIILPTMEFPNTFEFNSDACSGNKSLSGIQTIWIDAGDVTQGKNVYIKTPHQRLIVPGGKQGFYAVTGAMPFTMEVTCDAGTAGTMDVKLYNYAVLPGESQTIQTVSGAVIAQQGSKGGEAWPVELAADLVVKVKTDPDAGAQPYSYALSNAVQVVKGAAGKLWGFIFGSSNAAACFVQIFDAAAAVDVTLGVTVPKLTIFIPAGTCVVKGFSNAVLFADGICIAATTLRGNAVAPASPVDVNIDFE